MARAVGGIASERDILGGHWFPDKEGAGKAKPSPVLARGASITSIPGVASSFHEPIPKGDMFMISDESI